MGGGGGFSPLKPPRLGKGGWVGITPRKKRKIRKVLSMEMHTHTHTHIYKSKYIYVCVCVCVCALCHCLFDKEDNVFNVPVSNIVNESAVYVVPCYVSLVGDCGLSQQPHFVS
jgi:hypothetical protein